MCGRKSDPSVVEKSTTKNEPIGYNSTPEVVALHIWKEALEIVEADRCFGIHSRPEDVYKDLLDLENI